MSFTTPHGITVPFPDRLAEGYEITPRSKGGFQLKVNVDASRLADVFRELVGLVPEPGFLVLEARCNLVRELELRKTDDDPFHRDVYYLDGLDQAHFLTLFTDCSDLLVNDGFVHFGYGSHDTSRINEVFVGDYKVLWIFAADPGPYESKLGGWRIPRVEKLLTARDTFTEEHPGYKNRWSRGNVDIYEILETLIRRDGLYHVKTIED